VPDKREAFGFLQNTLLHQIPGSAIFLDEAHAAMPASHWRQMWRWLRELCDEWGCHLLLASGSLARFWELPDFVPADEQRPVPELVSDKIRTDAAAFEDRRVQLRRKAERLSLADLGDFVLNQPGPRLVILNTVQSAAILANYLRYYLNLGVNVECQVIRVPTGVQDYRPARGKIASAPATEPAGFHRHINILRDR
jgi:hypothetical protein